MEAQHPTMNSCQATLTDSHKRTHRIADIHLDFLQLKTVHMVEEVNTRQVLQQQEHQEVQVHIHKLL